MKRQKELISMFAIVFAVALLLPCLSTAGSLEPPTDAADNSGNPVPTMKTLDQIPPTWSQKLQCDLIDTIHGPRPVCPRFEVLTDFTNEAVLDKETGLVWEKSPSATLVGQYDAYNHCNNLTIGGRLGWRLPTAQELATVVDPTHSNPALPLGHPFSNVQSQSPAWYWSASTDTQYYSSAGVFSSLSEVWFVDLADARLGLRSRDTSAFVWCVRGANSTDLYIH